MVDICLVYTACMTYRLKYFGVLRSKTALPSTPRRQRCPPPPPPPPPPLPCPHGRCCHPGVPHDQNLAVANINGLIFDSPRPEATHLPILPLHLRSQIKIRLNPSKSISLAYSMNDESHCNAFNWINGIPPILQWAIPSIHKYWRNTVNPIPIKSK